jgi:phosphohistidine phosphatase
VRLILVRHAHAVSGEPDELRSLSERGRDEARTLAEQLHEEAPDVVVTSPLLRARETAAAIAAATGTELRVDERLAPGATAEDVLAVADGGTVVVVGHQPDCSEITLALAGRELDFPTAGHTVIEL